MRKLIFVVFTTLMLSLQANGTIIKGHGHFTWTGPSSGTLTCTGLDGTCARIQGNYITWYMDGDLWGGWLFSINTGGDPVVIEIEDVEPTE